jgi:hypothetical protein
VQSGGQESRTRSPIWPRASTSQIALQRGLAHAINAGHLLIEAEAQIAHGRWLPERQDF